MGKNRIGMEHSTVVRGPHNTESVAASIDGLNFNQQNVDDLVVIYNHSKLREDIHESLFRAIKVCKEWLKSKSSTPNADAGEVGGWKRFLTYDSKTNTWQDADGNCWGQLMNIEIAELSRLRKRNKRLVEALEDLFAGGFIEAGTRGNDEWSAELYIRLTKARAALAAQHKAEE